MSFNFLTLGMLGGRFLKQFTAEQQDKTDKFEKEKKRFLTFIETKASNVMNSFKRFLREDNDTKLEFEVRTLYIAQPLFRLSVGSCEIFGNTRTEYFE